MPVPARCAGAAMLVPEIAGGRSYEYIGRGATGGVRVITRRLIRAAHRRGIPVLAWTINRPDNMRRLIEWGIDGIVTDRIDLLKDVMREKGLPDPAAAGCIRGIARRPANISLTE